MTLPLRMIGLVVGAVMVIYALVAHLVLPGIAFALLIIGGILLVVMGAGQLRVKKS